MPLLRSPTQKSHPINSILNNFNILITGPPGVGKTTLIERILEKLDLTVVGFFTREIRNGLRRIGFELETFSGFKTLLASKSGPSSRFKVGSYNVYIPNLEKALVLIKRELEDLDVDLIIIDEIGKMELFSESFRNFILYALSTRKLLATIMLRDNSFTRNIKTRTDVKLIHLSLENRNIKLKEVIKLLTLKK